MSSATVMTSCLVIQQIADAGLVLLKRAGLKVNQPRTTEFTALKPHLFDACAVITRNHGLSAAEIAVAPNLKVIVSHGAGIDAIDKPAADARGVPVLSTPGTNTTAVAEHTMALMLACARQVPQADKAIRDGDFDFRYRQTGFELYGKTLGLVGYGRIAQQVAHLARAFGMQVLACSQHSTEEEMLKSGVEHVDLHSLRIRSDIVSLHTVPGGIPKFDAAGISELKSGAMLINTARGALIDEAALVAALKGGHLVGAALDVFDSEPTAFDSPLVSCPSLILTPHIGGSAHEALKRTAIESAKKVIEALGLPEP
jgi:D-3-phosphoglycerate dehydrogenase